MAAECKGREHAYSKNIDGYKWGHVLLNKLIVQYMFIKISSNAKSKIVYKININFSKTNLPTGLYFLKIISGHDKYYSKITYLR